MKDKILEILKKDIDTYQMVNDDDPIMITGTEKAASEIEALIKENYVKKEFVEWMVFSNECNLSLEMQNYSESEMEMIERLCEYWLTQIKDK